MITVGQVLALADNQAPSVPSKPGREPHSAAAVCCVLISAHVDSKAAEAYTLAAQLTVARPGWTVGVCCRNPALLASLGGAVVALPCSRLGKVGHLSSLLRAIDGDASALVLLIGLSLGNTAPVRVVQLLHALRGGGGKRAARLLMHVATPPDAGDVGRHSVYECLGSREATAEVGDRLAAWIAFLTDACRRVGSEAVCDAGRADCLVLSVRRDLLTAAAPPNTCKSASTSWFPPAVLGVTDQEASACAGALASMRRIAALDPSSWGTADTANRVSQEEAMQHNGSSCQPVGATTKGSGDYLTTIELCRKSDGGDMVKRPAIRCTLRVASASDYAAKGFLALHYLNTGPAARAVCILAETDDGQPAGFIACELDSRDPQAPPLLPDLPQHHFFSWAKVSRLVVVPAYRGLGLKEHLLGLTGAAFHARGLPLRIKTADETVHRSLARCALLVFEGHQPVRHSTGAKHRSAAGGWVHYFNQPLLHPFCPSRWFIFVGPATEHGRCLGTFEEIGDGCDNIGRFLPHPTHQACASYHG